MNKPLLEALKEVARLVVFSAVAVAIDYFAGLEGQTFVFITIALRGIDKYIHKSDTKQNGLLFF